MTIEIARWGRDHWSTLLYIEDICVNGSGEPVAERMRQWPGRPVRGRLLTAMGPLAGGAKGYPTRLKDGTEVEEHDDFDCAEDMVAAGLVEWRGTGLRPVFRLTALGWAMAGALRQHLAAEPRSLETFDAERVLAHERERVGDVEAPVTDGGEPSEPLVEEP